MHKRKLSSFVSPLYVTGRKLETNIPLLLAYFKSLLVTWKLWRRLRSCILCIPKDPYQQLWKPANLRVNAQPCAGRCGLPPASHQRMPSMSQLQSERGITMLPCHPLLLLPSNHLQATPHILKNSLWKSSICYCCVSVWMCLWHLTHIPRLIAQICFLVNRKRFPTLRFQMLGLIKDQRHGHRALIKLQPREPTS